MTASVGRMRKLTLSHIWLVPLSSREMHSQGNALATDQIPEVQGRFATAELGISLGSRRDMDWVSCSGGRRGNLSKGRIPVDTFTGRS